MNFGQEMGSKDPVFGRRYCTWKFVVLHGPSPTADTHILTKHNTNIKTSHEWQKCTNKYDPLDGNLYSISWRESPDTSTVPWYATMKIKEIIHIIFSLIVYHTLPTRDPRVGVDTSGNLILCCKPQICCLALRAAPISWRAEGWIPPFGRKGAHQDGRSAGFAWCNPDPNGRTCAVLVCYFT